MNVLPVSDLCPYFVSERIISLADNLKILNSPTSQMAAELLLETVSCRIQKGDSNVLTKMLVIIERHGIDAAKKLSQEINARLEDIQSGNDVVEDDKGA